MPAEAASIVPLSTGERETALRDRPRRRCDAERRALFRSIRTADLVTDSGPMVDSAIAAEAADRLTMHDAAGVLGHDVALAGRIDALAAECAG